jgi:hypothetical protein
VLHTEIQLWMFGICPSEDVSDSAGKRVDISVLIASWVLVGVDKAVRAKERVGDCMDGYCGGDTAPIRGWVGTLMPLHEAGKMINVITSDRSIGSSAPIVYRFDNKHTKICENLWKVIFTNY